MRNRFRDRAREIIDGPVVSEIDVENLAGLIVTSVITTRSVKAPRRVVCGDVAAPVKSPEVAIATL